MGFWDDVVEVATDTMEITERGLGQGAKEFGAAVAGGSEMFEGEVVPFCDVDAAEPVARLRVGGHLPGDADGHRRCRCDELGDPRRDRGDGIGRGRHPPRVRPRRRGIRTGRLVAGGRHGLGE
jgi:hypothetical protein